MGEPKRYGEKYRQRRKEEMPEAACEVCGEKLDVDRESGEQHCPVCENPDL